MADLDLVFPLLRRLRRLAKETGDDEKAGNLASMVFEGSGHRWTLHEAAHGNRLARSLMPGPEALGQWRVHATLAANELAHIDPDWYATYSTKGRTTQGRVVDQPPPERGWLPEREDRPVRSWFPVGDWMRLVSGIDEDGWWPMEWPW